MPTIARVSGRRAELRERRVKDAGTNQGQLAKKVGAKSVLAATIGALDAIATGYKPCLVYKR
jgi:hypothetical protein